MKRTASVFLASLVLVLTGSLAWGQASVPNLVNFQGRLTDTSGVPIADGSHNLTFSLFSVPSGGSSLWNEAVSVTTKDGLFTHQLGSNTPFSQVFFQTYDSLFMEITVEAEVISPRTLLTSTPYTRLANNLEMRSSSTDTVGIATLPSIHNLIVYGFDGTRNVEMGGTAYGEIWLKDGTAGNNLIVDLTATTNSGGSLLLNKSGGSAGVDINAGIAGGGSTLNMRNDIGSVTVGFDADGSGNTAAVLPVGSVSAIENLDEPGVSNTEKTGFFFLDAGNTIYVVDSVDITTPGPGYIEVTCTGYINAYHTNGTNTEVWVAPGNTRGSMPIQPGIAVARVPFGMATALWQIPFNSSRLYYEASPGLHRYYMHSRYSSGTDATTDIAYSSIRAIYYPTLYGTVSLANVSGDASQSLSASVSDGSQPLLQTEVTTITVGEHNTRLQAELETMRSELEARIQKLEQQTGQNQQSAGSDE